MKINKEKIFKSHKRLFTFFKKKVEAFDLSESEELKSYRLNLEKYERRPFKGTSFTQLEKSISKSNFIFIGDFHSLDQGSRNVFRLLTHSIKKHKIVLALEMIESRHQACIDAFLEKHITETEFLEEIDYQSSWRFPWLYYRQLFELARKHGMRVIGLNKKGNLGERDKHASILLSDEVAKSSTEKKYFIFYGEYHLTPNKIPQHLKNTFKSTGYKFKPLVIYQNLDHAYWRAQKLKSAKDIIRYSQEEFALLVVPPWLKYESMLHWLQNHEDDPEYEIHQYALQSSIKFFNDDINDHFLRFSIELNTALNLKIKKSDLENFNILDGEGIDLLISLSSEQKSVYLRKINLRILGTAKTASLLGLNYYFCPSYSFNRLSYLVGFHLYFKKFNVENSLETKTIEELFNFLTNAQMFAYFCSKIFNPYRKCNLYLDFKSHKEKIPLERTINKLTLQILEDRKYPLNMFNGPSACELIFSISRNLGHYLGEMLFAEDRSLRFGLNEILNPPNRSTLELIGKIINKKDMKKQRKRVF